MENVEKLLVEKLGVTQMNQHQALSNLHKVVQICNSGIQIMKPNSMNNVNRKPLAIENGDHDLLGNTMITGVDAE